MIVYGCCVGGDGERFSSVALPRLTSLMRDEDRLITIRGEGAGISRVYNTILDQAVNEPDCEAVVLLHDDVEIVDPDFVSKVRRVVSRPSVGVAGVAGGSGLTSLEWWKARTTVGKVHETRGLLRFSQRAGNVDAVDGMLMIVAPAAYKHVRFDESTFPHFHGYDVDYCLQVKEAGSQVEVIVMDVLHRTKTGLGDESAFRAAEAALLAKWTASVKPLGPVERARDWTRRRGRRILRGAHLRATGMRRRGAGRRRANSIPTPVLGQELPAPVPRVCPVCDESMMRDIDSATPVVLTCSGCGTGIVDPPPNRDLTSAGLFVEMYGDQRLAMRPIWFEEARKRLEWLLLYQSHGRLLEVGCGTGEFVRAAIDGGFEAEGVEVSEWAATEAEKLGVTVTTGFLSKWVTEQCDGRVDVVALWHVLEHVEDPLGLLQEILTILRPGALLVLEVPNGDAADLERLGLGWRGTQPADHYFLYSLAGLRSLLERAGFEVRDVVSFTGRIYSDAQAWEHERAEALLGGYPWPSLDFLRAVATVPTSV